MVARHPAGRPFALSGRAMCSSRLSQPQKENASGGLTLGRNSQRINVTIIIFNGQDIFWIGAPRGAGSKFDSRVRDWEAFRACVEAVGLGWRAQPGMAVPRGFAEKCEPFQVAGLRCRGFDAGGPFEAQGKQAPPVRVPHRRELSGTGGRRVVPLRRFRWLTGTWARRGNHSERRACMTSTRAARAAGSIEATTAAPNNTNAETITGNAPGIFKSPK
jgi:hypothetical protein